MNKNIIYISSIPWNYAWHRQQEMMSKMAEAGFRILFVQPCSKKLFKSSLKQQTDNIWLLTPAGLPYERVLKPINFINSRISRKQILNAMKKIAFDTAIIWLDRVHGFDFKYFSKDAYTIYDLVDEILAFGRKRNEKMLISLENKVLKQVDLLLSSSQTLLKRKLEQCGGREGKENKFIPNGVDTARFKTEKTWEPLVDIKSPKIGFIGTIGKRSIDFLLIDYLVKRNPDWQFVFIGPGGKDFANEVHLKNVHIFDKVDGSKIPCIVNSFDVGIIPYLINKKDMDYVFPRKACEFFASGKPVVSVPLPEVQFLTPYVKIADTFETFEEKIKEALTGVESPDYLREYAKKFDWNILMETIISDLSNR